MNRRAPAEQATKTIDSARTEVEALQAALAASEAKVSDAQAQIAALTLMIEKLRRYGRRSERSERLLGQLELELDELTASATEDELAAETAPGCTTKVKGFERRRPSRKPFPEHLPRERVVVARPRSAPHRALLARPSCGPPARSVQTLVTSLPDSVQFAPPQPSGVGTAADTATLISAWWIPLPQWVRCPRIRISSRQRCSMPALTSVWNPNFPTGNYRIEHAVNRPKFVSQSPTTYTDSQPCT